jgi:hypothetical protein
MGMMAASYPTASVPQPQYLAAMPTKVETKKEPANLSAFKAYQSVQPQYQHHNNNKDGDHNGGGDEDKHNDQIK